jgi:hypothetical protein
MENMPGALDFFIAVLLLFPVVYTFPFLLRMVVGSYPYLVMCVILILYLSLLALSVYLLSLGYLSFFI